MRRSFVTCGEKGKLIFISKQKEITPELLRKCSKDDRKAVKNLYEWCFVRFIPTCKRYHINEDDARASFNLAFIKILKNLDKTDLEKLKFGGWAKRIIVNTLIDEFRKKKNYRSKVQSRETEWELETQGTSMKNDAEGNLEYEKLMQLVNSLPEVSAQVFKLYVIEGFAHKEIAEKLEMSEGTSKWHLSTARKELRSKLEKLETKRIKQVV